MESIDIGKKSSITVNITPKDFMKVMNVRFRQCFGYPLLAVRKTLSKELFDKLYTAVYYELKESMLFTENKFVDKQSDNIKCIRLIGEIKYEDFINFED